MTVTELINILKTMSPQATVVLPGYQDRADVVVALSLEPYEVQAVQLRKTPEIKGTLKFKRRIDRYELDNDGELPGVAIGYVSDDGALTARQIEAFRKDAAKLLPSGKTISRDDLF